MHAACVLNVIQSLWRLREEITPGLLDDGYCYKYDISLPLHDYYRVVEVMRERLRPVTTRVVAYGHVGDGLYSIHVSLKYRKERFTVVFTERLQILKPQVQVQVLETNCQVQLKYPL